MEFVVAAAPIVSVAGPLWDGADVGRVAAPYLLRWIGCDGRRWPCPLVRWIVLVAFATLSALPTFAELHSLAIQ